MSEKTVFHGMVEEEYERALNSIKIYREKVQQYPKGSVCKRVKNGHTYFYLLYRKDGKVITEYIGNDPAKADELRELIAHRKAAEKTLKRLLLEQKEMEYMLKYKGWRNDERTMSLLCKAHEND